MVILTSPEHCPIKTHNFITLARSLLPPKVMPMASEELDVDISESGKGGHCSATLSLQCYACFTKCVLMFSFPFCFLEQLYVIRALEGPHLPRETIWTQCFFTEWFLITSSLLETARFQLLSPLDQHAASWAVIKVLHLEDPGKEEVEVTGRDAVSPASAPGHASLYSLKPTQWRSWILI